MQIIADKNTFKFRLYIENISKYKFFISLLLFLILGILFGALAAKGINESFDTVIIDWFNSFLEFRKTSGFTNLFFSLFLSSFVFMIFTALSSFGISGIIALPILVIIKGFGTCLISGILYRNFSLSGIAFADLILLPFFVANNFIAVYVSAKGMELSSHFLSSVKDISAKGTSLKPEILVFLRKILMCILCSVMISLTEAMFTKCFIKYFNF